MNNQNNYEPLIKSGIDTYTTAKNNYHLLTDDNKAIVSQVENAIVNLPENSALKKMINERFNQVFENTKELGDFNSMRNVDTLRQSGPSLALVKKETRESSSRAAFINIAILLYGVVNIGVILAIALMK